MEIITMTDFSKTGNSKKQRLTVIKIGGSILTYKKEQKPKFNTTAAFKIAKTISYLNENLILVHGAGSFGHTFVQKHNLLNEKSFPDNKILWSELQSLQYELNTNLCKILRKHKLAPFPFQASAFFNPSSEFSLNKDTETIMKNLINKGLTPVLYGTPALFDKTPYILSGDTLVLTSAVSFKADRIVFLTDTDGIFDKDPQKPNAELIRKIKISQLSSFKIDFGKSQDTTGAMKGKFEIALKAADFNIPTYIINGNHPERIFDVFEKDFIGTLIEN